MNIHKNARLTLVRRREMVRAVTERGLSRRAAGRLFGLSAGRVGVWVERYREEGEAGLYDRSSRPHRSPTAITLEEAELMLALRQSGLLGEEIAARLKRAKSTVSKVLKAAKLSQQRQLDRDPEPRRYEHKRPGDLLHLDIKKLGKFKRPGHRVAGRGPGRCYNGAGWEYVHVAIDDHSRVAYVELLNQGEQGEATAGFLRRAVEHFRGRGVRVRRVLTDNGSGYRSRAFRRAAKKLRIKLSRTKPYTPKTNGKAERFIQTIQREWAYVRPYNSSVDRRRALPHWLRRYNEQRPHKSLGGLPPISRLEASA